MTEFDRTIRWYIDEYIEALKNSLILWIWLYKNPNRGKKDSPYWEEIEDSESNCYLCDLFYSDKMGRAECRDCILVGKSIYHCCDAYFIWKKNYKRRKSAAAWIASKIRREYERLTDDKTTFRSSNATI